MNKQTILGTAAGLLAGVAVVLLVVFVGGAKQDASEGASTATAIRQAQLRNTELLQLVKSCTVEPAGKCARVQRRSTEAFLDALADERTIALSYALSCVDAYGRQTPAQIARCIREGMHDERAAERADRRQR